MGRFGGFLGRGGGETGDGRDVVATPARAPDAIASTVARSSARAAAIAGPKVANIAIALDATGSMAGLLDAAKSSLGEIMRRVAAEAGRPVVIRIFAYRDYDVPEHLLARSPVSDRPDELVAWLRGVHPIGGGGNDGEAVEVALAHIADEGGYRAVLLAGDEPSNARRHIDKYGRRETPTALEIARTLGGAGCPVHALVVGNAPATVRDFGRIAEAAGGRVGRLNGSAEMTDLAVLAILSALKGVAGVRAYMEGHELGADARAFGALLLGGPSR